MSGTKAGAAKTAKTIKEKYGENYYREIGRIGGKNGHVGGFAANHDLARKAGSKGGSRSRKGYKLIGEDEKSFRYKNIKTGAIVEVSK